MLCIGNDMQERMELLGLTVEEVADKTFLEEETINAIINNEIALEEIDGLDNAKSMNVKAKIQDFMNDFAFVTDVLSEVE